MPERDDLKRWRQLVRSRIRKYVKEQREAPPLTLWVSHGSNVRRCAPVHVGAAADAADVALKVRETIVEAAATHAALGKSLADVAPGAAGPLYTTEFGLVVCSVTVGEGWHAPIRAGTVGGWEESPIVELERWGGPIVRLLQSSLRQVRDAGEPDLRGPVIL